MQLVQIQYFLAACDTTNFSHAAKRCGVTQPALTRSIQALERELGGLLFLRQHHQTRLTLFGQLMRAHFERIHQDTQALQESAERYKAAEGTTLNIGVMQAICAEPFRKILKAFGRENRTATVTIVEGSRSDLTEQLLDGVIHLAVMGSPARCHDTLQGMHLYRESFAVAFAADHRFRTAPCIDLADIAGERQIAESGCEIFRQLRDACRNAGHEMAVAIESERGDWLQSLVAAGLGIALVSDATTLLPRLMTRPIAGLNLSRDVELFMVAKRPVAEPATQFLRAAGLEAALSPQNADRKAAFGTVAR
jgi:LysR family transcriptional regulator, hydrogen peroxide-inducible genes activator